MNMKQVLGTALVAVTMMASVDAMARGSVPAGAPLVSPGVAGIVSVLLPSTPGTPAATIGATDRVAGLAAAIKANTNPAFSLR